MTATACPACAAGDLATELASNSGRPDASHSRRVLSLPSIHCAGCIRGVEAALSRLSGVSAARVNFSLKRVTVEADDEISDADLIDHLTRAGFEAYPLNTQVLEGEADAQGRALLWRMGLAGFAMMNVMLLSVAVWSGAQEATRDMFHWISAAIALPVTVVAAQPFFASAAGALRGGRMNMDVPIALAIAMTVGMSLYETSQGGRHAYFDAALALTFFLLIGRYLDHRMRRAARSAAKELTALEPAHIRIEIASGDICEIALSEVQAGDLVVVQPGGRLAVDGVLEAGESLLDLSFITGEAEPVPSRAGQHLTAGTIALTGPLRVSATGVGEDSTLRRLAALVEIAENARGAYRSLSDRAAATYAPGVHILAGLALFGWLWATGDWRQSMNVAVAVLIITCPCALGLAVPAVATNVTARLFRRGVLLKNATALERLSEIDMVIFDKTGTLTRQSFDPEGVDAADLPVLKALASASDHPLARAIVAGLPDISAATLNEIQEQAGFGVRAVARRPLRLNGFGTRLRPSRPDGVLAGGPGAGAVEFRRNGASRCRRHDHEAACPGFRHGAAFRRQRATCATAGARTGHHRSARRRLAGGQGRACRRTQPNRPPRPDGRRRTQRHRRLGRRSRVHRALLRARSEPKCRRRGAARWRCGSDPRRAGRGAHRPRADAAEHRAGRALQRDRGAGGDGGLRDATDRGHCHVGQFDYRYRQRHAERSQDMNVLVVLIPVSLGLGLLALAGFLWTLKSDQYSDIEGDAMRILNDDDTPPEDREG